MNSTRPTMMNQQGRKSPQRGDADAWHRSAALGAATLLAVGLVGATVALQKVAPSQ